MQQQSSQSALGPLVHDEDDDIREGFFRIGDLAREFGITLRALRFYEDRKLLTPTRAGSTRLYTPDDRERLKLILLAKRVGFSLTEIEEILEFNDQENLTTESIEKLIEKFSAQIPVLNGQKAEVEQALSEVDETISYLRSKL